MLEFNMHWSLSTYWFSNKSSSQDEQLWRFVIIFAICPLKIFQIQLFLLKLHKKSKAGENCFFVLTTKKGHMHTTPFIWLDDRQNDTVAWCHYGKMTRPEPVQMSLSSVTLTHYIVTLYCHTVTVHCHSILSQCHSTLSQCHCTVSHQHTVTLHCWSRDSGSLSSCHDTPITFIRRDALFSKLFHCWSIHWNTLSQ